MGADWDDGIKWYLVFLFSTCFHEAAHAWAALRLGDDTAARGGQVSLNPLPHIRREPWGMVAIPLLSFMNSGWMIGWASAPYSIAWAQRYPRRAALMGLAGPAANLVIFLGAALLLRLGLEWGFFHPASSPGFLHVMTTGDDGLGEFAAKLLSLAFSLNLLLALFNLLPVPPLDGSVLPLFFLPPGAAEGYLALRRHPVLALGGIFAGWWAFGIIFPPVLRAAIALLTQGAN
jgi:Zn-dependent protease